MRQLKKKYLKIYAMPEVGIACVSSKGNARGDWQAHQDDERLVAVPCCGPWSSWVYLAKLILAEDERRKNPESHKAEG